MKKILIIDDEEKLVKMVSLLLKNDQNEIDSAYNGEDGLEKIISNHYDLIICDINMPKMNGIAVIKATRELNINYPFLFFTAHGNEELMLESLKYGAQGFIDKPCFDNLQKMTQEVLGSLD